MIPNQERFSNPADDTARPALAQVSKLSQNQPPQVDAWPEKSTQNWQILTQDWCD
jgi:hypothetical protein